MAPRRTPPTVRAALHQLAIATATGRDLPFIRPVCPLCGAPLTQDVSGTLRPLRHFSCSACGWWLIVSVAAIRYAIEGAADPDDGDDTASASNGSVWFNAETGKLVLYPTEWDRKKALRRSREKEATA
ncbi:MAG: hypothetical protein WC343_10895 [Bacilli bacterium]|jgi:hypothetical protein